MDTIGLLAAWVGIFSFLAAIVVAAGVHLLTPWFQRWSSKTAPMLAQDRIQRPNADIDIGAAPDNAYIADLIELYGKMILNLIAAVALIIVSIEILDLAPSLLASTLPFNIDAKILTRATGLFLLISVYWFVFRLSYLAMKIRNKTWYRRPGYSRMASSEIALSNLRTHPLVETGPERAGDPQISE
jgi:hypothetical protein